MENRKRYTAIVLAAGSGRRMQSDTPKQFMELCGHPLVYTVCMHLKRVR